MHNSRFTPASLYQPRDVNVANLVVAAVAVCGQHTFGGHDRCSGAALADARVDGHIRGLFPRAVEARETQAHFTANTRATCSDPTLVLTLMFGAFLSCVVRTVRVVRCIALRFAAGRHAASIKPDQP